MDEVFGDRELRRFPTVVVHSVHNLWPHLAYLNVSAPELGKQAAAYLAGTIAGQVPFRNRKLPVTVLNPGTDFSVLPQS